MLDTKLIESSLALTGKTMEDMYVDIGFCDEAGCDFKSEFSIEKFGWYLLSPEFIKKYDKIEYPRVWSCRTCMYFGLAIYEYQSGNEKPLIELLSKICHSKSTSPTASATI